MKFIFNILAISGILCLTSPDSLAVEKTIALKKYDFMVAIYKYSVLDCGGSLIRKNVVLTAAHCARYKKESYFIFFDSNNTKDVSNKTKYEVSDIYRHKDNFLREETFPINDIALFKLEKNIENSVPIEIYGLDYKEINEPVTFIGWGDHLDRSAAWDLEMVNLNILNHNCCVNAQYAMGDYVGKNNRVDLFYFLLQLEKNNNTFLCAEGIGESVARVNHRDSGGPLFLKNGNDYKLVGVASYYLPTGNVEEVVKPISIFKNLMEYKDFIDDGIKHFNSE